MEPLVNLNPFRQRISVLFPPPEGPDGRHFAAFELEVDSIENAADQTLSPGS